MSHERVCSVCKHRIPLTNFWTETVCKYCAKEMGRAIYRHDQLGSKKKGAK